MDIKNNNNEQIEKKIKDNLLANRSDCFSGQRDNEDIEAILMKHWVVLVPTFLVTVMTIGLLFTINAGINYLFAEQAEILKYIRTIFDCLYLSIIIHYFFISILNYYLTIVIITNLRIIDVNFTTVFKRHLDALDLHNIQDINMMKKGFWRWLLNFGRITMHNSAGTELFDFKYFKDPIKSYNIINHVHFKAMHRRTRGEVPEKNPDETHNNSEDIYVDDNF